MAETKQLGAYSGEGALYFVESLGTNHEQIFKVDYGQRKTGQTGTSQYVPAGMQLNTALQQSLAEHKISSSTINVSLPTRDIIFRSFIIPWMQPNEVKGVIEFEASKYIPFPIAELSYSYQISTITEDGIKRIRVIFVAIKKDALQKYTQTLENIALEINIVEPAPLSLIRLLVQKEFLAPDKTVAIIEKTDLFGKIIIVDKLIPQFVREFQLKLNTNDQEAPAEKDIMLRLSSEIRISLDYFNRQDNSIQVEKIIFITPEDSSNIAQNIEKDLDLEVKAISANSIVANPESKNFEFMYAYGVSCVNPEIFPAHFDLSDEKKKKTESAQPSKKIVKNYKSIAITAVVCIPILFLAFFLSKKAVAEPKEKIAAITKKLGIYSDAETSTIKTQSTKLTTKLDNYKKIRTKSDATFFLAIIPQLLPEGTWLKDLSLEYTDVPITLAKKGNRSSRQSQAESKRVLDISGYAFQKNTKEQFRMVNEFLKNLKNHSQITKMFNTIELESVKADQLSEFTVTYFKIKCE